MWDVIRATLQEHHQRIVKANQAKRRLDQMEIANGKEEASEHQGGAVEGEGEGAAINHDSSVINDNLKAPTGIDLRGPDYSSVAAAPKHAVAHLKDPSRHHDEVPSRKQNKKHEESNLVTAVRATVNKSSDTIRPVYQKLLESAEWKSQKTKHIYQHPMLIYLRNGRKNNDSGWLRKEEASVRKKTIVEGKQRVHLDSIEKDLLAKIHTCIEDVKEHKTPSKKFSPIADLAYAFGVSTRTVRNSKTNDYEANGTNKRKQRSDAGRTLFNGVAKREQIWTPQIYHSKK